MGCRIEPCLSPGAYHCLSCVDRGLAPDTLPGAWNGGGGEPASPALPALNGPPPGTGSVASKGDRASSTWVAGARSTPTLGGDTCLVDGSERAPACAAHAR